MNSGPFLLVKARNGLGNRLLCALTGLLYARLTHRQLVIDWSDPVYSSDGRNAFDLYFRCDLCPPGIVIPADASTRPAIWRGNLHEAAIDFHARVNPATLLNPTGSRAISVDLSRIDYEEDVLILISYFDEIDRLRRHFKKHAPELHGLSTRTILTKLLNDHLSLQPSVLQRVEGVRAAWPARPMIGVHIRYSDKKFRVPAIRAHLDALLARHPDCGLFLATDNRALQEEFADSYPTLVTAAKWFPVAGRSMHWNAECTDRLENGIEALIDLYLLAGCDYLVVDESSSFSYIASVLSKAPDAHIINVQVAAWLPPRLRRLLWLTWLRVPRFIRRWIETRLGLTVSYPRGDLLER